MKTNKENIFAAGDIVTFPLFIAGDEQANVQHWQMAHTHGNNFYQKVSVTSVAINVLCSSILKNGHVLLLSTFLSSNHVDKNDL